MIKSEKQVKVYLKELKDLENLFMNHNKLIFKLSLFIKRAAENKVLTRKELLESELFQKNNNPKRKKSTKSNKIPTAQISYEMYREGNSISEIAKQRGLVISTIEGHLAKYVEKGDLDVTELLQAAKLERIMEEYRKGLMNSGEIKGSLGEKFSYSEIKLGIAHAKAIEGQVP